jgi:hypothetical protein
MTNQNANIELVIAVLNGINIDGESMQYIIEKVGMEDQMRSQLGAKSNEEEIFFKLTPMQYESLVEEVVSHIEDSIDDIISDTEFSLSGNCIEVDSYEVSRSSLSRIIEQAIDVYVTVEEPANAL